MHPREERILKNFLIDFDNRWDIIDDPEELFSRYFDYENRELWLRITDKSTQYIWSLDLDGEDIKNKVEIVKVLVKNLLKDAETKKEIWMTETGGDGCWSSWQ